MNLSTVKSLRIPEGDVKNISCNGVVIWHSGYSLGELSAGTIVHLLEDKYIPYIVVAHNHHGSKLTTLVRQHTNGYGPFRYSNPSSAYNNMYPGSNLETEMRNLFSALPEKTRALIKAVGIPIREYASTGGGATTVNANFFPLSEIELTGSGSDYEGSQISYFANDTLRKATDESGIARLYWTRSVTGGMETFARTISSDGVIGSQAVTMANVYLRPACCIASNVFITETDGVLYLISEDQIEDGTDDISDVIIPEMTLKAEEAWGPDVWLVSNVPCTFVEGRNYAVVCDGISYHCTAVLSQNGDCVLVGSENDSTYPFCIQALNENGFMLLVRDSGESVTIAVYSDSVSDGGDTGGDSGDDEEPTSVEEIFPKATLGEEDAFSPGKWFVDVTCQLVNGVQYLVLYNNMAYQSTAYIDPDSSSKTMIGSSAENERYPFCIKQFSDDEWYVAAYDSSTSVTIQVYRMNE